MKRVFINKTVLITGGSSGIGQATAINFAELGAKVIIVARRNNAGEATLELIKKAGGSGEFIQADMNEPEEIQDLFSQIKQRHKIIDAAFLNAGIEGPKKSTTEFTLDEWMNVINVNVTAVWLCMKYIIPLMVSNKSGSIVINSSVAGLKSSLISSLYGTSKHAVIGLVKSTAKEYAGKGIRINAICPGVIRSEMTERIFGEKLENGTQFNPMGRIGMAVEVARTVVWLCSQDASFITGTALPIDGGLIA